MSQIVLGWAFCLFFKSLWFCVFTIFSLLVLFLLNHQMIGRGVVWSNRIYNSSLFSLSISWLQAGLCDYLWVSEGCFGYSNVLDSMLP